MEVGSGSSRARVFPVLDAMQRIATSGRVVVLVRHAERPPLPAGNAKEDVGITEQGMDDSVEFGKRLPRSLALVGTCTGKLRTRQTLEGVLRGFAHAGGHGEPPKVLRTKVGSYIHDAAVLPMVWTPGFFRSWIAGQVDSSLIDGPLDASRRILRILLDPSVSNAGPPRPGQIRLHVGHDWDLHPLRWTLFGVDPEQHPVDYLDGLVLAFDGRCVMALSGTHECTVMEDLLAWGSQA